MWSGKRLCAKREIKVRRVLKSGTWNNLTITLLATKPDEFGHIELTRETSEISLYVDR
jgi:hypothetical protein